ncbi:hypothetical protein LJK88_20245 [Paenibacillus sp. P26]|nr:hypothetical protein LJK88_20245 [Paenibacillus sp. P26]
MLKPGGMLVVQDRTPEDCLLEGSPKHLRGYWFESYPRLIPLETGRRHSAETVKQALREAGFAEAEELTLWERRKRYARFDEYEKELLTRTGRSILHELTDEELLRLAAYIRQEAGFGPEDPVVERDRWTIWFVHKK